MLLPSHAGRIYLGSRFVCLCVSGKGTGVPATSFPQFALGSCGLEGARGLQIPLWDLFSLALAAFSQRRSGGEGLLPRWLCAWVSGSFSDCKVNGEANETKEQVWDNERTSHILSHRVTQSQRGIDDLAFCTDTQRGGCDLPGAAQQVSKRATTGTQASGLGVQSTSALPSKEVLRSPSLKAGLAIRVWLPVSHILCQAGPHTQCKVLPPPPNSRERTSIHEQLPSNAFVRSLLHSFPPNTYEHLYVLWAMPGAG
uniref:uncharacterized protein LOC132693130 n=1 Tax=Panthera onca TaxID=9690 RepID=UPI002952C63F|nr:uncharacterized protein LOC132693130 [Panthera onca]